MTENSHKNEGDGDKQASSDHAVGKWAAVVDDVPVPMPRRKVGVSLVKELAGVPSEDVLVRDHNSPNDVVFDDGQEIDLAAGNVFYRLKRCELNTRAECHDVAKRAWFLNDVFEVTIRPNLTGKFLRELFSLPANSHVLRDVDGPHDVPIELSSEVKFEKGPVFIDREVKSELKITVNSQPFTEADGVKKEMTGKEIAALVYPDNPDATTVRYVSQGNRDVPLTETIKIHNCDVFDVVRKDVTGGLEKKRIEREIEILTSTGQRVTLLTDLNVVIYHDLRTRSGSDFGNTDVLVPVPSGYPAMIDFAYLPVDSPLIGHVKGKPQDHRITALGREWRQISYHPHNGGGAPPWNPTRHGFHTYVGELLSWLHDLQ